MEGRSEAPAGPSADLLSAVLACPQCQQPFSSTAEGDRRCVPCTLNYPQIGTLPWLFADPVDTLHRWRNRWHAELRALEARAARLDSATETSSPRTRRRLGNYAAGLRQQAQELMNLLLPLGLGEAATGSTFAAFGIDGEQDWYHYDANIFRDWSWGEAENAAALSQLSLALRARPRRIAIIGSGAGRLAYDLHRNYQPELTVALEYNPLLALIGHQVSGGAKLELTELPLSAVNAESIAVPRTLARPAHHGSLRPELTTVIGDVLDAPFQPNSFDLVVTSWFTDICPAPSSWLTTLIAGLLTSDGCWLNHGSVAFAPETVGDSGSLDELIDTAQSQGLHCVYQRDADLPYLQSPASRHQRTERVSTQRYDRAPDLAHPSQLTPWRPTQLNWVTDATVPISLSQTMADARDASAMRAFILSLIDGKRSRTEMAQLIQERGIMSAGDAEAALVELLIGL